MVLLQISEPGQSPQPHQRKHAVGIDLGTTNSLVSAVRSGMPETLARQVKTVIYCRQLYITLSRALAPWVMRQWTSILVTRSIHYFLCETVVRPWRRVTLVMLGDQLPYDFIDD